LTLLWAGRFGGYGGESGVPHSAGHASVRLKVQLDVEIGLMAPSHDDPAVSFPMSKQAWSGDACGGAGGQSRQYQAKCCQPSELVENKTHAKQYLRSWPGC